MKNQGFSSVLIVGLAFLLQGCFATSERVVPYKVDEVRAALSSLDQQTDLAVSRVRGASVYYHYGDHPLAAKYLPEAEAAVHKPSTLLNNASYTALELEDLGDSTRVRTTSVSKSFYADARTYSELVPALLQQEWMIRRGLQPPHQNRRKSPSTFLVLNALSPTAGFRYVEKGNPLVRKTMRPWNYAAVGCMEALGYVTITTGLLTSDRQERAGLITVGIASSIVYRLIFALAVGDVKDYNLLARSHYHLPAARP